MSEESVLLVEDSADDRFFFERAYRKSNFGLPLLIATDGAEAVARFSADSDDPPALVLLDLKLPKLSGHDVLGAIRKADPSRRTVVLCFTGSHEPSDRRRAYEGGANGYLLKPASVEEIERLLQGIKDFWFGQNVTPRSALLRRPDGR